MSRPKPKILVEKPDQSYKTEQVLAADAIYAVYYGGNPINLRSVNMLDDSGPKYKKVSFSNSGHAHNLRDKLNKKFNTNKFSVMRLQVEKEVTEIDSELPLSKL